MTGDNAASGVEGIADLLFQHLITARRFRAYWVTSGNVIGTRESNYVPGTERALFRVVGADELSTTLQC